MTQECSCSPFVSWCPVHGFCACDAVMRELWNSTDDVDGLMEAGGYLNSGMSSAVHIEGCPLRREVSV